MKKSILMGIIFLLLCSMTGCKGKEEPEGVLETPTITVVPTLEITVTAVPATTNTPMPTETNTPMPTATSTPVPTATSTPTPTATSTPAPTATSTPVPATTNTPMPTATSTPVPTVTNTPVPTATNTPVPTATSTPKPTATPTPMIMVTYVENGDGTVTVDGLSLDVREALGSGNEMILTIPEEINGMKVVKVQEWAFSYIFGLVEKIIFMGEDTTEIGVGAFMNFGNSLESVELPEKLRCIASHAFCNCIYLKEIELPNTVRVIGPNAFANCSSLEKLELPASLEKIGEYAFSGTAIKEFTLPAGKLCVHKSYREGDTYFSTQPSEEYGDNTVFKGMSKLEKIYVTEGNELYTSIDGVLYNKDLTELIKVPQAYSKSIVLPDTLTKVNLAAFEGCEALEEISFPAGLVEENFYRGLLRDCPNLKKITAAKGSYGETFAEENGIEFEER